jgi:cation diffusion facilitator family transporter
MKSHSVKPWTHKHVFLGGDHRRNERRTKLVVALTLTMMVAEIAAGSLFGSLALLADGWHMATHAAALGISAFAYAYARRHADDPRFTFGTGKVGDLAAFTSAVILGLVAFLIAYESAVRLFSPVPIRFAEATIVAIIGLAVNLVSAWLLWDGGEHAHSHGDSRGHHHDDGHMHSHGDRNLRAAYLHVVADALTSVLAIVALVAGSSFGWLWLDPVIGIVGALVIARWAVGLVRESAATLLDIMPDQRIAKQIQDRIERSGDLIADLHIWRVGPGHHAAIVAIVSDDPKPPKHYKSELGDIGLSHVTVEVHKRTERHAA